MHVLLDLVPGHTSIEHPWFKASMQPEKNEYSGRYIWSNHAWENVAGYGSINGQLRGISQRNGCVAVNFYSLQPALNFGFAKITAPWQSAVDSPEALATRQAMKDVMAFWLDRGCDGFRVDMAGSLVKDDEGSAETIKLWQDMRAFLDARYPDAVLISEWGEPDKSLQGGFHMDFLLQFGTSHYLDLFRSEHPFFSREGKGDASSFVKTYRANLALTGGKGLMCIPSGNHDNRPSAPHPGPGGDEDRLRLFAVHARRALYLLRRRDRHAVCGAALGGGRVRAYLFPHADAVGQGRQRRVLGRAR